MNKRVFWVSALGLVAVLVVGGLFASNMGFKLNYPLDGPGTGGSQSGTSSLGLPYNQQTNIVTAEDLIGDINTVAGGSVVAGVSKLNKTNDGLITYTGAAGTNFNITPGEGYLVGVSTDVNYIIVGSHNPGLGITLDGPGTNGSASGTNIWSMNYHTTLSNAQSLITEIDTYATVPVVATVSQFNKTNDGLISYTGAAGTNFTLVPGEAYYVTVSTDVLGWVPTHF